MNSMHGLSGDRLYGVWQAMRERCNSPKAPTYVNYGGRGIKVCKEWDGRNQFIQFYEWALASGYDPTLQLDRIDNDGPYSPENCRWRTKSENMRNTRRTRLLTAFGETKSMAAWADDPRCSVTYTALKHRVSNGWDSQSAVETPKLTEWKRR